MQKRQREIQWLIADWHQSTLSPAILEKTLSTDVFQLMGRCGLLCLTPIPGTWEVLLMYNCGEMSAKEKYVNK